MARATAVQRTVRTFSSMSFTQAACPSQIAASIAEMPCLSNTCQKNYTHTHSKSKSINRLRECTNLREWAEIQPERYFRHDLTQRVSSITVVVG